MTPVFKKHNSYIYHYSRSILKRGVGDECGGRQDVIPVLKSTCFWCLKHRKPHGPGLTKGHENHPPLNPLPSREGNYDNRSLSPWWERGGVGVGGVFSRQ